MKRLFIAVVLMFTLVCSAFAYTEGKRIKDVGIPERVSFIQFDNGGRVTCEGTNVEVSILVQTNESMFSMTNGNKIQFYVYELKGDITIYKGDGSKEKVSRYRIIDSEALSISYY